VRDRGPQNANEYGNGEVAVAAPDQGLGVTGAFQSFESEKTDQVFRHGASPHQALPKGTWV